MKKVATLIVVSCFCISFSLAQSTCEAIKSVEFLLFKEFRGRKMIICTDSVFVELSPYYKAKLKKLKREFDSVPICSVRNVLCDSDSYEHISLAEFREVKLEYKLSSQDSALNSSVEDYVIDSASELQSLEQILVSRRYKSLQTKKMLQTPFLAILFLGKDESGSIAYIYTVVWNTPKSHSDVLYTCLFIRQKGKRWKMIK